MLWVRFARIRDAKILIPLLLGWAAIAYAIGTWTVQFRVSHYLEHENEKIQFQGNALANHIEEGFANYRGIAKMLALIPAVSRALQPDAKKTAANYYKTGLETAIQTTNSYLKRVSPGLRIDLLYIMDLEGNVIASSDWDTPTTLVGQNFKDRNYFKMALQGTPYEELLVGRSTKKAGMYFTQPVYRYGTQTISGVAAVKVNTPRFSHWINSADAIIHDQNGIVLVSKDEAFDFYSLPSRAYSKIPQQELQTRYQKSEFPILPLVSAHDRHHPELQFIGDPKKIGTIKTFPIPTGNLTLLLMPRLPAVQDLSNQIVVILLTLNSLGALLLVALANSGRARIQSQQFQQIFENSGIGIALTDQDGNFDRINQSFAEMLGQVTIEIKNQSLPELISAQDKESLKNNLAEVKTDPSIVKKIDIRFNHKKGHLVWGRLTCRTFHRDPHQGSHQKLLIVVEDITAQKQSEIFAKEQQLKMISASKMSELGTMAAGIAHEINNPLAIISGKATVLGHLLELPTIDHDKIKTLIASINNTVNRIAKIVQGMRNYSRDGTHDPFQLTEIRGLIQNSLELCGERIRKHGIELRVDRQLDQVEFKPIECNGVEITQVLTNLISNAHDAVEKLPNPWIEIKLTPLSEKMQITITDSGPGIPEAIAQRIMEPFFTTKEIGRGTGLGLSISKSIIEKHQGRLSLNSKSPNTQFVVEIPYTQVCTLEFIPLNTEDAVNAHLNWRQKLTEYLKSPNQTLNPELVASDRNCVFGKWLLQNEKHLVHAPSIQEIKVLHAKFHRCAGDIVRRANSGEPLLAQVLLGADSEYSRISEALIAELAQIAIKSKAA